MYIDQSEKNYQWNGGKGIYHDYEFVRYIGNPRTSKDKYYAPRHVLVAEEHVGSHLKKWEVICHIDRNTVNNEFRNFELLPYGSEHIVYYRPWKNINIGDREYHNCNSNTTRLQAFCKYEGHKTPRHSWYHLPWDKEN